MKNLLTQWRQHFKFRPIKNTWIETLIERFDVTNSRTPKNNDSLITNIDELTLFQASDNSYVIICDLSDIMGKTATLDDFVSTIHIFEV